MEEGEDVQTQRRHCTNAVDHLCRCGKQKLESMQFTNKTNELIDILRLAPRKENENRMLIKFLSKYITRFFRKVPYK